MAQLDNLGIDPNVKESSGSFTILPKGKYKAVILKDELKNNKANNGKLLELDLQIIEGSFAGTTFKDRLNITNASMQAQAIGQGILKKICSVCKIQFPPSDSRKLWGIPMMVDIDQETFKSNTDGKELISNKVKSYQELTSQPTSQPAAANNQPAADGGW